MGVTRDLHAAARSLRHHAGFAVLAIVTLALGIAVNGTFFTLIDVAALRGLPLTHPERLISVAGRDAGNAPLGVSYLDYLDLALGARTLRGLAATTQAPVALGDETRAAERVLAAYVTANALSLLGNTAALGRDFSSNDDRFGASPVAILSFDVWRDRYAGDAGIVGRQVRINGSPATIVGVMPERFVYLGNAGIWLPLSSLPRLAEQPRSARSLTAFGRIADDVTLDQARIDIERITAALAVQHADTSRGVRSEVVPLNDRYTQRITSTVWVTFIAAGMLVLLVSCANVANLLLSRATRRTGEMALRASLGASRTELVRQLLAESLLLATVGGIVGLALAIVGLQLLQGLIPAGSVPYWFDFQPSAGVLATLTIVCLGTVAVFGLLPALHVSRVNVTGVLQAAGRGGTAPSTTRRWTATFLAAQFALAFVLIALSMLTVRRAIVLDRIDVPVASAQIMTTSVTLPASTYTTPGQRYAFYQRLRTAVARRPDVGAASVASALRYTGTTARLVDIEGRTSGGDARRLEVRTIGISQDYFASLGLAVQQGREFTGIDGGAETAAAVVNTRFVETYLPGVDPIGLRIRVTPPNADPEQQAWLPIVGVSPTVFAFRAQPEGEPIVYLPLQNEALVSGVLLVRAAARSPVAAATLHDELRRIDADVPVSRTMTVEQALREGAWNARASNVLLTAITVISTLLALIGFYAVTAHSVASQTRELGIRVALGAAPANMRWLVAQRAAGRIAIGVAAGMVLTVLWDRLLGEEMPAFGLRITDAETLMATAAVVSQASALACWSPARRVARLDPIAALRSE